MASQVSNAISNVISILIKYWYVWVILFIAFFVIVYIIRRQQTNDFKPFKPVELKETLGKRLKSKMDLFGQDFGGEMFISFTRIGRISRYFKAKGKFDYEIFDPGTKEIVVDNEQSKDYNLIVFEKVHDVPVFRWLGLFRQYIILQKSDDNKDMYKMDMVNKRVFLFDGMDLTSYGNVWTNSENGIEYLNNISITRTIEQTKTHLENMPDKFAHLEMEQAKRERLKKIETELEKGKYKERETAGDTTIV